MADAAKSFPQRVAHFRYLNEPQLAELMWITVPGAFGTGLFLDDHVVFQAVGMVLLAVAALAVAKLVRRRPRLLGAQQAEVREGDYPQWAYWVPVVAFATPLILGPLTYPLASIEVPEPLATFGVAVYRGVGAAWSLRFMFGRYFRIGRRRIRRIATAPATRSLRASEDIDVVAALVATGAVDGNHLCVAHLARLLSTTPEQLAPRLIALEDQQQLRLWRMGLQKDPPKWDVTVTSHAIDALFPTKPLT